MPSLWYARSTAIVRGGFISTRPQAPRGFLQRPRLAFRSPGSGRCCTGVKPGSDRMEILQRAVEFLSQHRWGRIVDSGWTVWDLRIYCDPLIYLQIRTTQENHGGNKRLIRIHQRMRLRDFTWLVIAAAVAAVGAVVVNNALAAIILLGVAAVAGLTLWRCCTRLAGKAAALFQHVAEELDMIRCDTNTPTEIQPRLATGDS